MWVLGVCASCLCVASDMTCLALLCLQELIAKRQADEDILSSGFWLFVYDNYKSSREVIEHYLRTSEKNEVLQTFPTTNKAGLDFLYSRMAWCFSHPCSSLWWVFFDDLWENNGEMKTMRDKREMFDSRCSESLAYVVGRVRHWDIASLTLHMQVPSHEARGVGG